MEKDYKEMLFQDRKTSFVKASEIFPSCLKLTEKEALEIVEKCNKGIEKAITEHPETFRLENMSLTEKLQWKVEFMDYVYKNMLGELLREAVKNIQEEQ